MGKGIKLQTYKQRHGHDINGVRPVMIPDESGEWVSRHDAEHLAEQLQRAQSRIAELEAGPHHNGMMQLSNELAEMKRKCAEIESRSITVKWPDYVDGRTLGYGEVNHMIDLCVDAVELACHASGIRIKSED